MMFQGTYTSDFYRTVRNLLHDQITIQTSAMPADGDEVRHERQALDRRWQELLGREEHYRSPCRPAAGAAGATTTVAAAR